MPDLGVGGGSSFSIKADPTEIRSAGKKVVDGGNSYLDAAKKIFDTVEGLQQNWQGVDNTNFAATVNGYRPDIDALGKAVGNYGVFMQETATSLENLQAGIADAATRL